MSRTSPARGLLLAAVLMTSGSMARAQEPAPPAAAARRVAEPVGEEAQVVTVVRALFAAAERGDLAALDTLYAGDSLTVVEGAGMNRTWADYRDHHLAPELKEMKNFRYRPSDIEARVSGNLAWASFRYTLQAEAGARAVDVVGRGTAILERRRTAAGSRWVVRHTHTSGRARRPSDPAAG